jgi:FdhD protein
MEEFDIAPNPDDPDLTRAVRGLDQNGEMQAVKVVEERPLTLYLNDQEIVTMMTIGDFPDYLAIGYLLNQNMLLSDDVVAGVDFDAELSVVVVRTERQTNYEEKLKKRTLTSGCAQGTAFGDIMERFDDLSLPEDTHITTSNLYALAKTINTTPSLYLAAGAIHGCVLCQGARPLIYMEDVGRHNAVDKIAGWMFMKNIVAGDKIFYTTGRLTSEMVLKTAQMGIPILVSRSGFTAWGVDLARQIGMTLIGRARGKRFLCLAGEGRLVFDTEPELIAEEAVHLNRKAADTR